MSTSLLADFHETVPPSDKPEFVDQLLRIINQYNVDTYMPVLDSEILLAAKLREAGTIPKSVSVLAPTSYAAEICLDKYMASQWMVIHGIPSPPTWLASEEKVDLPDRLYIKKRCGVGSKGNRIGTIEDIKKLPVEERPEWLIQKVCDQPEVTVDTYFDPIRSVGRVVCRERIETKSGVCTKARVFYDQTIADLAFNLAKKLGISGTFCFQLMRHCNEWVVTDINPRPGAGTAMSVAVGMDFFAAYFEYIWGNDGIRYLPGFFDEVYVTRQYTEFVMPRRQK
ncbi:MAG: ATP-grasp domain-containing protein [Deltaproteobacteria bacterium]|nr:ATP-grasp domain-containing protein [Deltaproteobacteria bacterium]